MKKFKDWFQENREFIECDTVSILIYTKNDCPGNYHRIAIVNFDADDYDIILKLFGDLYMKTFSVGFSNEQNASFLRFVLYIEDPES